MIDDEDRDDPNPRAHSRATAPTAMPPPSEGVHDAARTDEVIHCRCGHVVAPFYRKCPACEGRRNLELHDRLAELVREARALMRRPHSPDEERTMVHDLGALGHPHPSQLLKIFAEDAK